MAQKDFSQETAFGLWKKKDAQDSSGNDIWMCTGLYRGARVTLEPNETSFVMFLNRPEDKKNPRQPDFDVKIHAEGGGASPKRDELDDIF